MRSDCDNEVTSIDELLSVDVDELSGSDAADVLSRLEKAASRVDAARLQAARRFDESCAWAATQARSAAQWHAITTGSAKAVSGSLFHLARNAGYMTVAVAAYAAGEITQSHLRLLARCVGPRTRLTFWRDEDHLVGEARRLDADAATTGSTRRDVALTVLVDPQTAQGLPTDRPLHGTLFGHVVPRSVLETLRCQATWSVAVLGTHGEILRLGRSERYASRAQRRALAIRDGGCVVPGCGAPPDECDAHHLNPYEGGGRTDIDELAFTCDHHHHRVHDGKLKIEMINGKPVVTLANGQPLAQRHAA